MLFSCLAFQSAQPWAVLFIGEAALVSLMVLFSSNSFSLVGRMTCFLMAFGLSPWLLPDHGPVLVRQITLVVGFLLIAGMLTALQNASDRNLALRYGLILLTVLFILTLPKAHVFVCLGLISLCGYCFSLHDQGIQPFSRQWIQERKLARLEQKMEEARNHQKRLESLRNRRPEENELSGTSWSLVE